MKRYIKTPRQNNFICYTDKMDHQEVIYGKRFESKMEKLCNTQSQFIQVISDFDGTLTAIKNKKTNEVFPSIIAILYQKGYLSEEYSIKAKELEQYYLPIEKDENIPLETRKSEMREWWNKHIDLLIHYGLSKKHLDEIINADAIQLREWCDTFFEILEKSEIPITIFSTSGLWTCAIKPYLEKQGINCDDVNFIANEFLWDENGKAIAKKEPLITSLNKDETVISKEKYPELYEKVKKRKSVILLWNGIWDADMAKDENNDVVLRIGFLEEKTYGRLEKFQELFDMVLIGDGDMNEILEIIKKICW